MIDEGFSEADWYSEETATFGDRMSGAREAMGLSQSDLAKRLGVKLKTLRSWEDDLTEPRANKLQMLSGILNVSLMWLLTGKGDGLEGPGGDQPESEDARRILSEMRMVRTEMAALSDRLGRLEKQLRTSLRD